MCVSDVSKGTVFVLVFGAILDFIHQHTFYMGNIKYHILLHKRYVWVFFRPHHITQTNSVHEIGPSSRNTDKTWKGCTHQGVRSKSFSSSPHLSSRHVFSCNTIVQIWSGPPPTITEVPMFRVLIALCTAKARPYHKWEVYSKSCRHN